MGSDTSITPTSVPTSTSSLTSKVTMIISGGLGASKITNSTEALISLVPSDTITYTKLPLYCELRVKPEPFSTFNAPVTLSIESIPVNNPLTKV